ncbi:hypothetical protein [Clostridium omnivorum]|uniref:hypothetical protein n=1 Tax=Clostridium omnivorum TaxID=1604902 RepID=UPI003F490772
MNKKRYAKSRKAHVLKCEFIWDGIGTFAALGRFLANCRGNSISGTTFMEQSENCTIFERDKLIIGFGVKDLIIVDAGDVLLIMDKNRDQEIKHLVTEIKQQEDLREYL